ncbi:MAG: hypothetical protein FWF43_09185 [Propionibacteriaceae bacterium]|nr:hypothetical protein [Propionibacteriaceae bacterium]
METIITTFGPLGLAVPQSARQVSAPPEDCSQLVAEGAFDEVARGQYAATCMDRRLRADGTDPLLPNLPGGFLGLVLAARSVWPAFDRDQLTVSALAQTALAQGLPVYAHIDDDFQPSVRCGCSFNDFSTAIAALLPAAAERAMAIVEQGTGTSSVKADDVVQRMAALMTSAVDGQDSFGDDAFSRLAALQACGATTEVLTGSPTAVGVDISFRHGHTLSRAALLASQAVYLFHVDAWSFLPTSTQFAQILPRSEIQQDAGLTDEAIAQQMTAALMVASLATASRLCDPDSLLIIRS